MEKDVRGIKVSPSDDGCELYSRLYKMGVWVVEQIGGGRRVEEVSRNTGRYGVGWRLRVLAELGKSSESRLIKPWLVYMEQPDRCERCGDCCDDDDDDDDDALRRRLK